MTTLQIIGFIVVALLGLYVFYCIYDLGRRQKTEDRRQNKNKVLTVLLTMAALFAGQQAFAETVTYTLSGTTAQNGHVELIVNASGSVSGTVTDQWDYTTTQTRTINLPGDITFNFGSDKTNSLSVRSSALHIGANSSTGGYITLTHGSKYIYHVTLRDRSNNVVHEAWNMAKSYEYRFQEIVVRSIEVEYATAIPITDAVISSINNSYYISNTAVTPNPTITWHDNTLTKGTHYTVGYQNNTTAGTATVTATGKGIFSTNTSVSKNYALVWATYTVHFNKNHNDATGTMSNQNFTYNTAQNLTANVFSRTYYDFAGWSTSVNGAVEYVDGQLVNNLTPINNETVTLYAKWNAINYNITYDLDGGSVVTANPTTYNVETPTFTLNNPTKPGYTFNGWTGTDLTEATQTVTIIQGSTGDRSYTAHWTPITYTVHFNANGGSGEMSDQNFTYNTAQNLTANAFSRTYYDFAGWSTSVNGAVEYADGQLVNNLTPINNETVTLYAKWNAINYNITYDLDGGSVATANPTTYNVETPTFTLNNPTKPGYTFNGWTGTDLTETTQTVTITLGSTGDRSYTALWTPNTYTVHFDANNGEGTMNDMSFTYDQTQNLTANTFTRENYNFSGWNTSANGSGTSYTDGQSVSNLTTESNGTVTLYAQWANIYWQGSGTEDDPYIISNTAGLDHLASEVNSGNNFSGIYFKLGNNIEYDPNNLTIDGDGDGNNDSNYTAIGGNHDGSYKVFKGHIASSSVSPTASATLVCVLPCSCHFSRDIMSPHAR